MLHRKADRVGCLHMDGKTNVSALHKYVIREDSVIGSVRVYILESRLDDQCAVDQELRDSGFFSYLNISFRVLTKKSLLFIT